MYLIVNWCIVNRVHAFVWAQMYHPHPPQTYVVSTSDGTLGVSLTLSPMRKCRLMAIPTAHTSVHEGMEDEIHYICNDVQ